LYFQDGSAVELVGLSYSSIKWLSEMFAQGHYKHRTVTRINADCCTTEEWTLKEWANKIKASFEQHFFVSDNSPVERRSDLINKTNIYKDTFNSEQPWTDYQLRCNFPITMAVAPDLFKPDNAWAALQVVRSKLLGPLGMVTLDPDDWTYRGYYDNANQSSDRNVAHGYNYHQGPEWVWPVGYFLRAYLYFGKILGKQREAQGFCMSVMSAHYTHVQQSHVRGVPELTNKNGENCPHSNPIQAWSMACILEVLNEIEQ
jgi:glycogen debranching enzyme